MRLFSGSVLLAWLCLCMCPGLAADFQPSTSPPPNAAEFDGPAELPRIYIKTSLADTPAPGKDHIVKADASLQDALDGAACGDTIQLEAGAVFSGEFLFPKKSCDDAHWIIVRTSSPDSSLPPEGTRLTPCYAGVASLPGRPDFHCISSKNVMAKLVLSKGNSGPLLFADGANHYRFIGIEVTRDLPGASVVDLAGPKGKVAADHIIFDRVWMHGTAHDETRRGLFLSGTTYMAVIDSYFSDFHCTAMESCVDSQAISGASGDLPMGPFKIVNDFLEASGENILLGGAAATATPSDIEIRRNHLFKPTLWMRGQPGFIGGNNGKPFIVKNDFELKNAQRVLFEGNILENSWGGFSQSGIAIVLTPKNPNGSCPSCRVNDITIRYCTISHVGGAFNIANVPGDSGSTAAAGERYSIHDVAVDDIDGRKYNGFGSFLILISNTPALKSLKMDHITSSASRVMFNMGIKNGKMQDFTFTNNLIGASEREVTSTGGGLQNCAFQPERQTFAGLLQNCVTSYTFTNNVIISGSGGWPAGNSYPKAAKDVGFVEAEVESAGLRLCRPKDARCKNPSRFAGAGTDGKDIGADVDLINSATKGVI